MAQNQLNTHYRLLAIGGSAGSLQVVLQLLQELSPAFSLPILLVLHRSADFDSNLETLIAQRTRLHVQEVEEKEIPKRGNVYISPADYHVLLEKDGSFSLDTSEKINHSRPSIDVVFSSAADALGKALVCLLLSGANADGTAGLLEAKERGATILIQHPDDAQVAFMPASAVKQVPADRILAADQLGSFLNTYLLTE